MADENMTVIVITPVGKEHDTIEGGEGMIEDVIADATEGVEKTMIGEMIADVTEAAEDPIADHAGN